MMIGSTATAMALALGAPQATDAPAPVTFEGVPDVTVIEYPVEGRTAAALRKAINQARPTDVDGERHDAVARWNLRWRWQRRIEDGVCRTRDVEVMYSGQVTLPRLADPDAVAPALRARWDRYLAALRAHEAGHLRHPYDQRDAIRAAIEAVTCDEANGAAQAAIAALRNHDRDYDRETDHGRTQGAVFP